MSESGRLDQGRATLAWHAAAASWATEVQLSSEQRRRARPAQHTGGQPPGSGGRLEPGSGTNSSSVSDLLNTNIPAFSGFSLVEISKIETILHWWRLEGLS